MTGMSEDTLVLISTFQRQDLIEAVRTLLEEQVPVFWIVPLHDDMEWMIPEELGDCLLRWDVPKLL